MGYPDPDTREAMGILAEKFRRLYEDLGEQNVSVFLVDYGGATDWSYVRKKITRKIRKRLKEIIIEQAATISENGIRECRNFIYNGKSVVKEDLSKIINQPIAIVFDSSTGRSGKSVVSAYLELARINEEQNLGIERMGIAVVRDYFGISTITGRLQTEKPISFEDYLRRNKLHKIAKRYDALDIFIGSGLYESKSDGKNFLSYVLRNLKIHT